MELLPRLVRLTAVMVVHLHLSWLQLRLALLLRLQLERANKKKERKLISQINISHYVITKIYDGVFQTITQNSEYYKCKVLKGCVHL